MKYIQFEGLAGIIDCAVDIPESKYPIQGLALMLHPHPLYDGTRDNKVVTTMARACLQQGLVVVRPNFRGVGKSDGQFDQAKGETQDMLTLLKQLYESYPEWCHGRFVLGGFSFGTAVAAQMFSELKESQWMIPDSLVLAGAAVWRFQWREVDLPEDVLIVHGQEDEVVPLSEVFDWVAPYKCPVTVLPKATHFFHGYLVELKRIVSQYLTRARV